MLRQKNAPAEKMAPASKSDQHRATEKGESDSKQLKSQKMDKGAATGAAHKGPADAADNADAKPKCMNKADESGGRGRHVHQLDSVVVKIGSADVWSLMPWSRFHFSHFNVHCNKGGYWSPITK
jgi:hypothetical protein